MLGYLADGTFQRSTWYKLLLHADEQQIEINPTLVPTGPPVPTVPLAPPDFALVTNQHIGIPYNIQQVLLTNGILYHQVWYKFYLTYQCGDVPPPILTARAINPDHGWNWDEAYVITPNIAYAKIVDEFNTISPTLWGAWSNVAVSDYGLTFTSGPAINSYANIISASAYAQGDWTIDFNIERYSSSDTPPDQFTYIGLDYTFNVESWEVTIAREYRPDVGHVYSAYIWTPDEMLGGFVRTNSWRGSLRIIRYQNSITLLAKDYGAQRWQTVAYTRVAPMTDSGYISMYNTNGNVPQTATATIERYISSPGVMFGLEPALYTNINPSTITLLVQPQLTDTVRFVDIVTYTQDIVLRTTVDGFEYIRPHRFSLGGKPSIDWWIYRDVPTQPDVEQANIHADPGTRLMNLTLTPTFGRYLVGQSVQYKVIAKFNDGSQRDITDACEWTTTDTYGTIQNGLMVFGSVTGTYFISATYQGLTQTATAYTSTVTRAAQTITLEDNDGVRFSGRATLV
jgi:hypothetical protein